MNKERELSTYKQQVLTLFDRRIHYDRGDFHPRLAHRLVELAELRSGQVVLDAATGTGLVAIEAAQIVGSQGEVRGVDLSPGMLDRARKKIKALGLTNIEVRLGDIERVEFLENFFDTILCCSALIYLENIPAMLHQWHRFLKPRGKVGFNGFSQTAFATTQVLIKVAAKYGIELLSPNEPTGTEKKCYDLLHQAGFADIEVRTEQFGSYISLSQAQSWRWEEILQFPFHSPLLKLPQQQLLQFKDDYCAALEAKVQDGKIWNDITTFWVLGRKQ